MKGYRYIRIAMLVAVLSLAGVACETFKSLTTEISYNTGEMLKITVPIMGPIADAFNTYAAQIGLINPSTGKPYTWDELPSDLSQLPVPIKFSAPIPLPNFPVPPEIANDPVFQQYKSMFYGVRINSIILNLGKSTPMPATLPQSLFVITDYQGPVPVMTDWYKTISDKGGNMIATVIIPEIPVGTTGAINGSFAPGGQDAASELLKTLSFGMGFLFKDASGNFSQTSLPFEFDSTKMQKPTGDFVFIITVDMTFKVAPLG